MELAGALGRRSGEADWSARGSVMQKSAIVSRPDRNVATDEEVEVQPVDGVMVVLAQRDRRIGCNGREFISWRTRETVIPRKSG